MSIREFGVSCLKQVLESEKNVRIFEKAIDEKTSTEEEYKSLIYNTLWKIKDKKCLKDALEQIKNGEIFWNSPGFYSLRNEQKEQDDFLLNPFDVEEGVMTCGKCGSRKTYSYSKQLRSADEPTSTICICVVCKNKWISG
jgi:DNA-directed RNA polymerase subunit M/transcription elongation factor TFIIS